MNPLKETLITDYIYKDLPYGGTVTRTLMKELYEEYKRLQEQNNSLQTEANSYKLLAKLSHDFAEEVKRQREQIALYKPALAYYSHPGTYMALNGIPVLQDNGERAREALEEGEKCHAESPSSNTFQTQTTSKTASHLISKAE